MPASDATSRFGSRVADYVRYRPGYPSEVLGLLRREGVLPPAAVVADIGSGTGLSAVPFLNDGHTVYGVEPNAEMRAAAEELLAGYPMFYSVNGTAEATNLPTASIGLAVAGQAFHWFDPPKARAEFVRILRPDGAAALVWNTRETDTTPFLRGYEHLLRTYGTDYKEVVHTNVSADTLAAFFGPGGYRRFTLPNEQRFDLDGVLGRTRSSSFVPTEGHPNYEPLYAGLRRLFDAEAVNGVVRFEYETELYLGRME
ncbi:MAG TPA: class I SAM-dependent methyltransferase [Gemmataceae bacterium]|nr:class I SAM-dependent methyltransferase [Gemmataceae bacterium]